MSWTQTSLVPSQCVLCNWVDVSCCETRLHTPLFVVVRWVLPQTLWCSGALTRWPRAGLLPAITGCEPTEPVVHCTLPPSLTCPSPPSYPCLHAARHSHTRGFDRVSCFTWGVCKATRGFAGCSAQWPPLPFLITLEPSWFPTHTQIQIEVTVVL